MSDMSSLEPGQRMADKRQPLPRKKLGRVELALLSIMRIYVLAAIPIVVYAFVHALRAG